MTPMSPHHHDHDSPVDWSVRGQELVIDGELTAPMVDQALTWLVDRQPDAQTVIDVGSGPGVAATTFAQLLPQADVLAVDGAAPLLDMARERAERFGVGDRFTTREVSLPDGLTDLPPADLIWASGVVHHLPDPVAALRALGGLLRPGGLLAWRLFPAPVADHRSTPESNGAVPVGFEGKGQHGIPPRVFG